MSCRSCVSPALHWVSVPHAVDAEVRLYDHLFSTPFPGAGREDYKQDLNPNSLETLTGCKIEPSLADAKPEMSCQFMRHGYFRPDPVVSRRGALVFNRIVALRDSWAKIEKAQGGAK